MTRSDGSPLRYAWLTIGALLLVGVAVTVGVVVFTADGGDGVPLETTDPGVDPQPTSDPVAGPGSDVTGTGSIPASPFAESQLAAIHDRGITGENVSVGVVDVTGFDTSDPAIREQVRAARSFGASGGIRNGGRTGHGTAAASIVTRVAPDADLYLANFDDPAGFRQAVAWLLRQDVDVIVAPVSFYGQPDDGSAVVSRAATRASEQGVTVVAPVGNLAKGHWQGTYDHVEDGRLSFAPAESRDGAGDVPLAFDRAARNPVHGDARRFTLWLSWDRAHAEANYTAVLYRWNESRPEVVARSKSYREDDAPNERIVASLSSGRYFVTVEGPDRPTNATLELTTPTHRLGRGSASGSIAAPATGRGVVAVGAFDGRRGWVAEFSSRGPTDDGRPGVDVVAPGRFRRDNRTRLVGSSAAAPYVAGTVALVRQVRPAMGPTRAEAVLELTAGDVGRPGYDYAAGHGLAIPVRAVDFVTDDRIREPPNASDPAVTGGTADERRRGSG